MTHALQGHCPIILISLSFFGFHPIGVKSPHDAKKSGETDLYHFEHIDYIIVHTCVCVLYDVLEAYREDAHLAYLACSALVSIKTSKIAVCKIQFLADCDDSGWKGNES